MKPKTSVPWSIRGLMAHAERAGTRFTLLGIGPVSEVVVRATFEVAAEEGFPPMFIASRNQVDLDEFGSGYLMGGMNQQSFVRFLRQAAGATGYHGPLFICRDHGGPWQRNAELNGKLDVPTALALARKSFRADLQAGFNYLHVDPTKCPLPHTRNDLVDWTVELIASCEAARRELKKPPVEYEIGAEDIQGGHTSEKAFEEFIVRVLEQLERRRLPGPVCVVGQTGTLTRLDANAGGFHAEIARKLVKISRRHEIGFKEHNCDYLADEALRLHPEVGITGANVAPEFGCVETAALLELAECEQHAVAAGRLPAGKASHLEKILRRHVRATSPWKKWLPASLKHHPADALFGDPLTAVRLLRTCGHYVFVEGEMVRARKRLDRNLAPLWGSGTVERLVLTRIKEAIRRYVRCFRLTGLNVLADNRS